MKKYKRDLKGKKFGMLTVIKVDEEKSLEKKRTYWVCECECTNIISIREDNINENKNDCGCIFKKKQAEKSATHGMSGTRIHRIWLGMSQRCYIESASGYKNYGGRGIKVCDEWLNKENGFVNFYNWSIKNEYDNNLTIERKNVNGNYEPDNCRWATMKEQANNKRNTRYVTIDNETHSVSEWSEITGLSYMILNERYENNMLSKEEFLKPNDRCTIHIEYEGKIINLKELSSLTNISYDTLHDRYHSGLRGIELWD